MVHWWIYKFVILCPWSYFFCSLYSKYLLEGHHVYTKSALYYNKHHQQETVSVVFWSQLENKCSFHFPKLLKYVLWDSLFVCLVVFPQVNPHSPTKAIHSQNHSSLFINSEPAEKPQQVNTSSYLVYYLLVC